MSFWSMFRKKKSGRKKAEQEADNMAEKTGVNGLLSLKNLPQPQWTRFEEANSWEPEEHTVMYCLNEQDNVPTRVMLENGFVYYISQNRSPGHKPQGQDCMATATQGNWEIHVLCDGHDKAGHMVALGVCQQLPKILLRKIEERNEAEGVKAVNDEIPDDLVNDAFDETARVVCWTKEGIAVGLWVKVFEGQWTDKPGFIKEALGNGKMKVAIIDDNGYHLPALDRTDLRRPRYTGGCTCICVIRNKVTKSYKVALSGDSRLVMLPSVTPDGEQVMFTQPGLSEAEGTAVPEGVVTPAHNVLNEKEKNRLEKGFSGQYEFDGNFLVNPITKFAIQPTRGFGDFDMFGTGYTHRPEVTRTFKLPPEAVLLVASDGLFDTHVWQDEEIVSCLDKFMKDGLSNVQIIDRMYRETLERSHEGGYVDDISIFCYREAAGSERPAVPKNTQIIKNEDLPSAAKVKKKRDTKKNRVTIGRGKNDFTDLSMILQDLRKKKKGEGLDEDDREHVRELLKNNEGAKEGIQSVMKKLAETAKVDPKKVVDEDEKDNHGEDKEQKD